MNVNVVSNAADNTSQTNNTDSATQTNNMFLTLLTQQLKAQSPFDPVDPNQFVGQLVQFNTLDQLIQIRQILQQGLGTPASSNS
jgi:flagellar basal-body rod modification protein FlgD